MPSPISMVWQELRWIIRVSRPRFWMYLFGPYLIGITLVALHGGAVGQESASFLQRIQELKEVGVVIWEVLLRLPPLFVEAPLTALHIIGFAVLIFGYPLFPANLLLYGINDIFDLETDAQNPKKDGYEQRLSPTKRWRLLIWIIVSQLPWLFLFVSSLFIHQRGSIARPIVVFLLFLFLAIFYSAPPIRAKARPFLDSLFNILYLLPGLFVYFGLLDPDGIVYVSFPWLPVLAASLWCMAMHAYSAVPDIEADTHARLSTIATFLGARRTLLACAAGYAGSSLLAILSSDSVLLRTIFLSLGILYVSLMAISLTEREDLLRIYKHFPLINTLAGMSIFFALLFV